MENHNTFCKEIFEKSLVTEANEPLRTVLDNIDALIYIADMQTYELLFINEYGRRIWGDIQGQVCWQTLQKDQDGPCPFCTNDKLLTPDGEPAGVYRWESQNTVNDIWFHCQDKAIAWHDGRLVRMVIATDISNRKLIEQSLQKAHVELEQRVEERNRELQIANDQLLHAAKLSTAGQLSASFAHEFNNPLQGVLNVVKRVQKRAILTEADRKLVDLALKECYRMKELIKSLRQFHKPTSRIKMETNIHQLIDEVLIFAKKELKCKGITLTKEYATDLPDIWVVPDQIKQVIVNILGNAADAIGTAKGTVTLTTIHPDEKYISIAIKDSGQGISPEKIETIFEPFHTTKAIKGMGLGLSVSYGIVKSHGGHIRVDSVVGKGSTFTITLPINLSLNHHEADK